MIICYSDSLLGLPLKFSGFFLLRMLLEHIPGSGYITLDGENTGLEDEVSLGRARSGMDGSLYVGTTL